jgi:predicted unusual protein kinase regulating ubiquinone biosynthesis (AarF/ABC1/UbiB family)
MASDDHVESGRLTRMARLAKVAARTTADVLAAKAREKLGASDADMAGALRPTAERLVEVLGEMKGAATKMGQFISLVDQDIFPPEARAALHKLLHQTPQRMSWEQVQAAIRSELGGDPDDLFAEFSREPLASASMGQVHAATTRDGRDAVVKVQFPGVDRAIEADLRNAGMMARALSVAGGVFESRHYYEELAQVLRRELDYRQEVAQGEIYREALKPWPDLVVPKFYSELSSTRILTMERLRGPTMLQAAQNPEFDAASRLRIGQQLVAATWGPFLSQRVIHADPHPGNYIALPDGRLGVLDFGATKTLSPRFTLAYWHLLGEAFASEQPDIYGILQQAGFEILAGRAVVEPWLRDLTAIVQRPFSADHYDWGACRISSDVVELNKRHLMTAIKVRAPEESLMFYRSAAGAAGDLRLLKSAGNYRAILQQVAEVARQNLAPEMAAALQAAPGRWT